MRLTKLQRLLSAISFLLFISSQTQAEVEPLTVSGNQVLIGGQQGSLAGPSLFWSNNNWGGEKFYNAGVVASVKQDWNATLIRAAMGVDEDGGYLEDSTSNLNKVRSVVDAAIANDIYVIIDWHSHHAENFTPQAVEFFQQMATEYGDHNNVIYEIYNEPLQVSWSDTIKPYAEQVISAIRAIDPDNLIIVGTPTWSQDVDAAANDPITRFSNIAYTLHFYAGTHKQFLRDKAQLALDRGIALFATEWGTVNANGDGGADVNETNVWMDFLSSNNISHANWALNDKSEGASALTPGANTTGNWPDSQYTASGRLVRDIVRDWGQITPPPVCNAIDIPAKIEAENYCTMSGIQTEITADTGGGENVGWFEDGDWLTYRIDVPAAGQYTIRYRLASLSEGAFFQIESADGTTLYDVVKASATGDWQSWAMFESTINLSAGTQNIRLLANGPGFNINWFEFASDTPTVTTVRYDQNGDGKADILWYDRESANFWLDLMSGSTVNQHGLTANVAAPWHIQSRGDFDGDGKADMLWRNLNTGLNYLYLMDGYQKKQIGQLNTVSLDWEIIASGDYNGDGKIDLIWRNTDTGLIWMYLLDGFSISASARVAIVSSSDWQVATSADVNDDGKDDLIWRNSSSGVNAIYLMDGIQPPVVYVLNTVSTEWHIAGSGDVDGDGTDDLVWRNNNTGLNWFYLMASGQISQSKPLNRVVDQNWQIDMIGNFDGDNDDDILWRNSLSGQIYLYMMQNGFVDHIESVNTVNEPSWQVIE